MLTKSGAKLLDFGLAKWNVAGAAEEETLKTLTAGAAKLIEQGTILGTFLYMAPEQLEWKEADARTDLFAFGEVLYEMASARPAFAGKTKASLIAAILSAEPPPMATVQAMTPPALERVVRGCLEKDPDERWQTAHDIKLQLRAIAGGGSQCVVPAPIAARRKNHERLLLAALRCDRHRCGTSGIFVREACPGAGSHYPHYPHLNQACNQFEFRLQWQSGRVRGFAGWKAVGLCRLRCRRKNVSVGSRD